MHRAGEEVGAPRDPVHPITPPGVVAVSPSLGMLQEQREDAA